ncbi:hypothetical protein KIPB_011146, partial [Kipferlia bialata]
HVSVKPDSSTRHLYVVGSSCCSMTIYSHVCDPPLRHSEGIGLSVTQEIEAWAPFLERVPKLNLAVHLGHWILINSEVSKFLHEQE